MKRIFIHKGINKVHNSHWLGVANDSNEIFKTYLNSYRSYNTYVERTEFPI